MASAHRIALVALAVVLVPGGAPAQQGSLPPGPQYTPAQSSAPTPYGTPFKPGFELIGLAGYHIASDVNYSSGHASIDGSPAYGAALRFKVRPTGSVDVLWVYAPTNAHFYSTLLGGAQTTSLAIHYFQIGGSSSIRKDRLEPYLSGTVGAALFSPGSVRSGATMLNGSDIWRFAFTVGGGLKIWLIERVAVQLDARLLAPVWFSSASFYAGGGASAFAVSGGIPVVEAAFTGGVVIAP